jgi:hypothetical protein
MVVLSAAVHSGQPRFVRKKDKESVHPMGWPLGFQSPTAGGLLRVPSLYLRSILVRWQPGKRS